MDDDDLDRRIAIELNNAVWSHLDAGHVAAEDRDRLLYAAYASAHHWQVSGTVANHARAEHLIARAACVSGYPDQALHHARRCLELVESHAEAMAEWDRGFALEALARALAATGDHGAAREHYMRAQEVAAAIADDDDRAIVEGELTREPWFGLTTGPN